MKLFIHKRIVFFGCALTMLSSCGRNLEYYEEVSNFQKLSGKPLCKSAKVKLINKEDLKTNPQNDTFVFRIMGNSACLNNFSQSFFSSAEISQCTHPRKSACSKVFNRDFISISRISDNELIFSKWS